MKGESEAMCHNIKPIRSRRAAAKVALVPALGIAVLGVWSIGVSHAAVPCGDWTERDGPSTVKPCATNLHGPAMPADLRAATAQLADKSRLAWETAADHTPAAPAVTLRLNKHLVLWGDADAYSFASRVDTVAISGLQTAGLPTWLSTLIRTAVALVGGHARVFLFTHELRAAGAEAGPFGWVDVDISGAVTVQGGRVSGGITWNIQAAGPFSAQGDL
jgi:hypothetical protein